MQLFGRKEKFNPFPSLDGADCFLSAEKRGILEGKRNILIRTSHGMYNLRKKAFQVVGASLVCMPLVAHAQWNVGRMNAGSAQLPGGSIYLIIAATLSWLLAVLGFVAVMGFVISGIQYLVSAGNEDMIETAKRNMKYSIIGVIVALSGWIVIQAIDRALNGTTTIF